MVTHSSILASRTPMDCTSPVSSVLRDCRGKNTCHKELDMTERSTGHSILSFAPECVSGSVPSVWSFLSRLV